MRILRDKTLLELAKFQNEYDIAQIIIARLITKEILMDEPEYEYGKTIEEICKLRDTHFILIGNELNIKQPKALKLFKDLTILGDGECPHCGGKIEIANSSIGCRGDNLTPDDVDYIYACDNCGEIKENY